MEPDYKWIHWDGKGWPSVPMNARVRVLLRNGRVYGGGQVVSAMALRWERLCREDDIVAYEVVE